MLPVYVFDDGVDIRPLTGLRASFEVRYGPYSLMERLSDARLCPEGLLFWGAYAPEGLAALVRERWGVRANELRSTGPGGGGGGDTRVLALNGRWAAPDFVRLRGLPEGTAIVEERTGGLAAACIPESRLERFVRGDRSGLRVESAEHRLLVSRPWHARTFRDAAIDSGLAAAVRTGRFKVLRSAPGATVLGEVHAAESARIWPGAIVDASGGAVVLAESATLRPGSIVIGPAYIGPSSTVLERATIRAQSSIGPWCKVNGEVSGVVFHGYSNKAHDGFLGDSWAGEWVNLGAGTTNSNLLNTYGEVVSRATPGGANERTGEQFLGAIIGDHVKTAISTRLMTGAVIHAGAMLAGSAPVSGCVGAFAWVTDEAARTYRMSKFVEVMRLAMARRGVSPSAEYIQRVESLGADSKAPE